MFKKGRTGMLKDHFAEMHSQLKTLIKEGYLRHEFNMNKFVTQSLAAAEDAAVEAMDFFKSGMTREAHAELEYAFDVLKPLQCSKNKVRRKKK